MGFAALASGPGSSRDRVLRQLAAQYEEAARPLVRRGCGPRRLSPELLRVGPGTRWTDVRRHPGHFRAQAGALAAAMSDRGSRPRISHHSALKLLERSTSAAERTPKKNK